MSNHRPHPGRPLGHRADRGMSYADIEVLMRGVRRKLAPGVRASEPLQMLPILEGLHRHTVATAHGSARLDWAVSDLPRGVEGQTWYESESGTIVVEVSEQTYAGLEEKHPRATITVAHELTHVFGHAPLLMRISKIPHAAFALQRATSPQHEYFEDSEWQANAGAAALVMPADGLADLERRYGRLTPDIVRAVYGVSAQAAELRLACFLQRKDALITKWGL